MVRKDILKVKREDSEDFEGMVFYWSIADLVDLPINYLVKDYLGLQMLSIILVVQDLIDWSSVRVVIVPLTSLNRRFVDSIVDDL